MKRKDGEKEVLIGVHAIASQFRHNQSRIYLP